MHNTSIIQFKFNPTRLPNCLKWAKLYYMSSAHKKFAMHLSWFNVPCLFLPSPDPVFHPSLRAIWYPIFSYTIGGWYNSGSTSQIKANTQKQSLRSWKSSYKKMNRRVCFRSVLEAYCNSSFHTIKFRKEAPPFRSPSKVETQKAHG